MAAERELEAQRLVADIEQGMTDTLARVRAAEIDVLYDLARPLRSF
jgi:hypothetical protein